MINIKYIRDGRKNVQIDKHSHYNIKTETLSLHLIEMNVSNQKGKEGQDNFPNFMILEFAL